MIVFTALRVVKENMKRSNATYYGMVSLLDKYIGKILDKLEELGLKDNTIVVLTTDHGDFMGQHGLLTKGPFLYEDLLKIPFIVRYPDHIPENKRSNSMQSLIDLAPTFLNYLNVPVPSYMTGIDQSKVWEGKEKNLLRN